MKQKPLNFKKLVEILTKEFCLSRCTVSVKFEYVSGNQKFKPAMKITIGEHTATIDDRGRVS